MCGFYGWVDGLSFWFRVGGWFLLSRVLWIGLVCVVLMSGGLCFVFGFLWVC